MSATASQFFPSRAPGSLRHTGVSARTARLTRIRVTARWLAGITAFVLLLGMIGATNGWVSQAVAAGTPTARLVQVLGKMDKFYSQATYGNASDSEFRLDFVMEVPAGTVKADGSGLYLRYDYQGTFTGTYGPGIQVDNQGRGGDWMDEGGLITTPNLGAGDINQQYRIVRIDHFGPTDRVTVSMQGDLGGNYDVASTKPGRAPFQLPVTMQARVTVGGTYQYFSYQYMVTVFDVSSGYLAGSQQKVSAMVGWDVYWYTSTGNSQTAWGYVINKTNAVIPPQNMVVAFHSPWYDPAGVNPATQAGMCTATTSFYYQWLRSDGSPTSLTPTPQLQTITPTNNSFMARIAEGTLVDMSPASAPVSFAAEGPGYYRLVAWPIAVNPTLGDPTACTDYSYYKDSVGKLDAQNAFTVGSVFYTGGNIATSLLKQFSPNPMPFGGTSEAVFTLNAGESRVSGVGFTDTLPADLVFTGITEDTCGLANQSLTQADVNAVTDPTLKPEVGPLLSLQDPGSGGTYKTLKLQGGVAYDIQSGAGEVYGAVTPVGADCVIKASVKHTAAITGNSVCSSATAPAAQTNGAGNVSYQSLTTVLGFDSATKTAFGDCLSVTRQSDLSPTGAAATVPPGATAHLSTTVTSAGPSEIDT
ncbi:MAG: hypothetical protein LBI33_02640, partial [Propionibacteriaceae bacterium]|nr:hypothetical protein [Propionibacteriaceae bacterium]